MMKTGAPGPSLTVAPPDPGSPEPRIPHIPRAKCPDSRQRSSYRPSAGATNVAVWVPCVPPLVRLTRGGWAVRKAGIFVFESADVVDQLNWKFAALSSVNVCAVVDVWTKSTVTLSPGWISFDERAKLNPEPTVTVSDSVPDAARAVGAESASPSPRRSSDATAIGGVTFQNVLERIADSGESSALATTDDGVASKRFR